jgi:para-nitrobenzyl esterase
MRTSKMRLMIRHTRFSLGLTLLLLAGAPASALERPSVAIDSGPLIGAETQGIRTFLGIPYAAPPVGERRWKAPQAASMWKQPRDASRYGPACPQADDKFSGYTPKEQSEDCLYLNVWTPADAGRPLPVMVWLYGGAHRIGAASLPFYDGSRLAARGVIVVSFNYRLGYLGYFSHPALHAENQGGNFGLMDQVHALKWVRENIAAFGGDPAQVTIFGESAGGADVLYLMTGLAGRGLFQRAIVQSGGGWYQPLSVSKMQRGIARKLKKIGVPADADAAALRRLEARKLVEAQRGAAEMGFGPFLDGITVTEAPFAVFEAGREMAVPLIIGSNSWEANLMRLGGAGMMGAILARVPQAYRWYPGQDAEQRKDALFRDIVFAAPARWIAARHSQRAPSWLYAFNHVSSGRRGQVPGAGHAAEISYVFDTLDATPKSAVNADAADRRLAAQLADCWTAFAKAGMPDCGLPSWKPYAAETDNILEIDGQAYERRHPSANTLNGIEGWFGPGAMLGP